MPNSKENRQIELIKKYYDLDEEKQIITISLNYDSIYEILSSDFKEKTRPQFSAELLEKISSIIDTFPTNYKVDIKLNIADYDGFDPEVILTSLNDKLEMLHYKSKIVNRKNRIIAIILVAVGISVLAFMQLNGLNSWLEKTGNADLILEILDITGWVFIWEAVSLLFLSPSEEGVLSLKFSKRVNHIELYQSGQLEPVASEDKEALIKNWVETNKLFRFFRGVLIGTSSAFLAVGMASIFSSFDTLYSIASLPEGSDIASYIIFGSLTLLFALLSIFTGLFGIFNYVGKKNFNIISLISASILLAFDILLIIYSYFSSQIFILYGIIALIALLLFIVSNILVALKRKK